MATITSNGANGHHKFELIVTNSLDENSIKNNTSTAIFKFRILSLGGGWNWEQWGANISYTVTINGSSWTGTIASYDGYSEVTLKSGTLSVNHNSDGNKTISFSFKVTDTSGQSYTCGNASASGSMALQTISRYLSITSLSVSSITETSAVVSWSASDPRDSTYYSFDNGATWIGSATDGESLASDLKSGTFNIAKLTAGTTYNLKVKIKRTDSQLWTVSDAVSFSTYKYPYLREGANFTIGDPFELRIYNPLNRDVTVKGYAKSDGSEIFSGTTFWYNITGFNDANSVNAQYASIPNAQSGTYRVVVTYDGVSTSTDTNNVYRIKGTECPTINAFDYIDGNAETVAITGNDQHIVQNKSILRARFHAATANYGASGITRYTLECNGIVTESEGEGAFNIGVIDSARDVDLKLTAYDSRGLSASKSVTVKMLAYETPRATVELQRLNNYEDETYLTVSGSLSSVDDKNAITIRYRYKLSGGSYGSFTTIDNRAKQTLSLAKTNDYVFNVVVTDKFGGTFDGEFVLNKGVFPLFIDTVKNSVGINCFPLESNSLEVNGFNMYNLYKCEKNILLSKSGDGLKITIDSFGITDKIALVVAGADNASVTPVFKVIRIKKGDNGDVSSWGELNLGLGSGVTVNGNSVHINASQWSYFTVKAPLGCEISLTNSAL